MKLGLGAPQTKPRVTEENGEAFVADVVHGTEIGFKYLEFHRICGMKAAYRGTGCGCLEIRTDGIVLGNVNMKPSELWQTAFSEIQIPDGVHPLHLKYCGAGKIDLKEIFFIKEDDDGQ